MVQFCGAILPPRGGTATSCPSNPPPLWGGTVTTLVGRLQGGCKVCPCACKFVCPCACGCAYALAWACACACAARMRPTAEHSSTQVKVKKFTATNNFRLYKIPESLADLHERLEHLDLSYNNLQEFPLAICRLRYLTRLDINNNQIKCLPAKVDQLKSLETCYMDSNFLMAVPSTMTFLRNMKHFYIENNPLLKEEDKESAMMACAVPYLLLCHAPTALVPCPSCLVPQTLGHD